MKTLIGMPKSQYLDRIYFDLMDDLKGRIEATYGSVREFCNKAGIDRANLVKALTNYRRHEISIGTYIKVCQELGIVNKQAITGNGISVNNIKLRDYLKIDNNQIWQSIVLINFS